MASVLLVPLTGYFTPAVSDASVPVTKVNIENLIPSTPRPDYDREVLAPLHQAQLAKQKADQIAARIAAEQAEQRRLAEQERQAELERAREVQLAQAAAPVAPVTGETGDCTTWMVQAGITDVPDAMQIVTRESGCNPNAVNPNGGACGIGQQLPCGKWAHPWNDPVGGLIDMQNYVVGKYGGWANAWTYWQAHGNY